MEPLLTFDDKAVLAVYNRARDHLVVECEQRLHTADSVARVPQSFGPRATL